MKCMVTLRSLDTMNKKVLEVGPKQTVIPKDWSISKLKEVARNEKDSFVDGDWVESKDMVEKSEGDYQLIQLGNIGEGNFKGKCDKFVTENFFEENNCTLVEKGDLLISRMSSPVLRTVIAPKFEKKSITAVDIVVAKVDENRWDKRFIKNLLNYKFWSDIGEIYASGSTRLRISRKNMEKIKIPNPPLPEQKKIADILSSVDRAIERTDEIIEKTEELKKGLMQELLTKGIGHEEFKETLYGSLPEKWDIKQMKDIGEIVTGTTPNTDEPENFGSKYPFITPTDLDDKKYVEEVERYLSDKGYENSKPLPKNSVIVTCIASIGENAITKEESCTNQQINSIICKDKVNAEYLYYILNYHSKYLKALAGSTTVPIVSKSEFSTFSLPIPPLQEQKKIASILSSIDNKIQKEKQYKEKLEELKKGLMQKLLTGEVRVKTAN